MDKDLTLLLSIGISAAIGATLGILRSKIFASKIKTTLHYSFYVISGLLFLSAITAIFISSSTSVTVIIVSFVASIGLAAATRFLLVVKDTYTSKELDPIVNNWTSSADKNEIKLFGGDLDFFGKEPSLMDSNSQYSHLRSQAFNKVSILCEAPNDSMKKIRYGKILVDMPNSELRFYNPKEADLRVRGRIIKVNGVNKLLVYIKIQSGIYQAVETDTGNSSGALYNNIWELAWSLATKPSDDQLESFRKLFRDK